MNANSSVIITLCSHLCADGCKPLEPSEWSKLAALLIEKGLQPKDLINFTNGDYRDYLGYSEEQSDRIKNLFDRGGSLTFEIQKYESMGINIVTRADADYPDILKSKLKNTCPPLFYYSGALELNKKKYVGFVGSRTVNDEDTKFAENMVSKIVSNGYGVVSGGAKGIDTISTTSALEAGAECIEYVSDSLAKKIKKREVLEKIRNKKLILLSTAKPDAGFNAGLAMQRNKYIYIQSQGTIVVKSDYNKGGTWSGATEALKKDYCKVLCRENNRYPGNTGLIKLGAIPVTESWDGNINEIKPVINDSGEQLSLFG